MIIILLANFVPRSHARAGSPIGQSEAWLAIHEAAWRLAEQRMSRLFPYSSDGYNRVLKITITEPRKPQTIRVVRQIPGCAWRYFFDVPPHRVRRLFYAPGDTAFRTRNALELKYRPRSVGAKKRRSAMAEKIRARLGVTGTHVQPAGMRRADWMWLLIRLAEIGAANKSSKPGFEACRRRWLRGVTRFDDPRPGDRERADVVVSLPGGGEIDQNPSAHARDTQTAPRGASK